MPRFRELDGLRGIAALCVVLHHFTGGYQSRYPDAPPPLIEAAWGAYGVQLFFFISGFVILMSAGRAQRPGDFAISRVSRLYPVYWIAVTLAIVLTIIFRVPQTPQSLWDRALNYTMVQRWLQVPNVDGVYWTLAVEMQFYVMVFILLWWTKCRLAGRVVTIAAAVWMAVALVVAVWAGPSSRGLDPQLVAGPVKMALNITLAEWAPLFSAGMFAFLARSESEHRRRYRLLAAGSAGLGAAVAGILHSPQQALIVLGLGAVFLTVASRETTRPLLLRPIQWYGKVSYSMYIGHGITGMVLLTLLIPLLGRTGAMVAAFVGVSLVAWVLHDLGEVRGTRVLRTALRSHRPVKDAVPS
ncbi:acyltransferase [Raineyella sp.]|uniref:acyltransferase family protein n=1 Tax=Raineyella sp. TaxID=1911550 RepID=UPI002B1FA561|nr:acyltransferase [Raineyella sp.]MEA5153977.1 acyltransferase [Raineyella sp.]